MIWTSTCAPVEVGGVTLPELIREAAVSAGDRTALVHPATDLVVGYDRLADRVGEVARGLAARGFRAGDTLAIRVPNSPAWAGCALGAMAAGGTVTGIDATATRPELARQLTDSGATVLVTTPSRVPDALGILAGTPVREIVVLGEAPGAVPLADVLAGGEGAPDPDPVDEEAVALLPYSSGTTGLPKGVMLSHTNLVATVGQLRRAVGLTEQDTVLAIPPFSHVMGFMVTLMAPLAAGATVVTVPRFDFAEMLALIQAHRVTMLAVPPPVMAALARHPAVAAADLSSLRLVVSGGAPLGADLQRAVAARLPHAAIGQGYGMTETSVGIAVADRERGTVPGSVGTLLAGTELRVVAPDGRDLGPDEVGELYVRGPQVTRGYLGRPEATAALIDGDGWLRAGDLGRVDPDGNIFVVDRIKDLIKVSAHQVAPAELEALLIGHPDVGDAAVVGRPDDERGEVPVAVVVPAAGATVDAQSLLAWVAERVSPHKRLRDVQVVDELPRSRSGKLLRRALTV